MKKNETIYLTKGLNSNRYTMVVRQTSDGRRYELAPYQFLAREDKETIKDVYVDFAEALVYFHAYAQAESQPFDFPRGQALLDHRARFETQLRTAFEQSCDITLGEDLLLSNDQPISLDYNLSPLWRGRLAMSLFDRAFRQDFARIAMEYVGLQGMPDQIHRNVITMISRALETEFLSNLGEKVGFSAK